MVSLPTPHRWSRCFRPSLGLCPLEYCWHYKPVLKLRTRPLYLAKLMLKQVHAVVPWWLP